MTLRYTFRQLFFKKVLRPRRLYQILVDLDERLEALESSSGDDSEDGGGGDTPSPLSPDPTPDSQVYDVTVNVDTNYDNIPLTAYLVPESDLYSDTYEVSADVVGGVANFPSVEGGDYYVVLLNNSLNEYIGIKQINIDSDESLSFELGTLSYILESVSGEQVTDNTYVTVTDTDTSFELFTTNASASTLVAGDYSVTGVGGNNEYVTVVANTVTTVTISVPDEADSEEENGGE